MLSDAERNADRAEARRRKKRDDEFRPVADKEADPLARFDATLRERGDDARHLAIDLAPSYALLLENNRLTLRIAADRVREQIEETARPLGETFDNAIAVMSLTTSPIRPAACDSSLMRASVCCACSTAAVAIRLDSWTSRAVSLSDADRTPDADATD